MNIELVYIVPCDEREAYAPFVERFIRSYFELTPGINHKFTIVFSNGEPYRMLQFQNTVRYIGGGRDIGAFQHSAHQSDADMIVCCNTKCHFKHPKFLRFFLNAWESCGAGIFSSSASLEHCPLLPSGSPNRNPHLRTSCFACPPELLRDYPVHICSRADGYRFESGQDNFTARHRNYSWEVTANAVTPYPFRHVANGYRDGDQSELIAWDRATDDYSSVPSFKKRELEILTGRNARH